MSEVPIEIFFDSIFPILVKYNVPINEIPKYLYGLIDKDNIIFADDNDCVIYDEKDKFSDLTFDEMLHIENIHLNDKIGIYKYGRLIIVKIKDVTGKRNFRSKAGNTAVNGQITDAITEISVKKLGIAPAIAMGIIYVAISNSISIVE